MTGQGKDRKGGTERDSDANLVEKVHDQQDTGNHDKPGTEAHGSDKRGGTRAGAENVEPKRR